MKRWFVRVLWLAAWSGWAALGVGLNRELPRELETVLQLPMSPGDRRVLGFVAGGRELALVDRTDAGRGRHPTIHLFDPNTGDELRSVEGSIATDLFLNDDAQRHGVMFWNSQPRPGLFTFASGFSLVDLKTGEWRKLSDARVYGVDVHPVRHWVAFQERHKDGKPESRVAVRDFDDGREVFSREFDGKAEFAGGPFFLPGSHRLVVPTKRITLTDVILQQRRHFEIWDLSASPAKLERTVVGPAMDYRGAATTGGRIAFADEPGSWALMQVFDFATESVVLTKPRTLNRTGFRMGNYRPPSLSPNGKAVCLPADVGVRKVDDSGFLWTLKAYEEITAVTADAQVVVKENWSKLLPTWRVFQELDAHSLRVMESGESTLRTWKRAIPEPLLASHDGTLLVDYGGAVYSWPPRVSWLLFGVCQAILAAPLVMLWLILRWRSRRRERLQQGLET